MTILKRAINSFQALNKLLFSANPYQSVEHLNDDLLKDIGLYREGRIICSYNTDKPNQDVAVADKAPQSVIFIPSYLKDSGG